MVITSKDNELIKHLKKLREKKYRDEYKEFIIEGYKIIEEAIAENVDIKNIIVSESFDMTLLNNLKNKEYVTVSDKLFKEITNVVNEQGIIATVGKEDLDEKNINYNEDFYLILNDIQDPGNLGTIIRTADSLNLKQIIVSKGTVECYNPKVVRSTMGAIFRVKIIEVENLVNVINSMKEKGISVYATDLETNDSIYTVDYKKSAVVIGNEANGVREDVKNVATKRIKIPMLGKTESLNASIATSIILFEAFRDKLK